MSSLRLVPEKLYIKLVNYTCFKIYLNKLTYAKNQTYSIFYPNLIGSLASRDKACNKLVYYNLTFKVCLGQNGIYP